MATAQNWWSSLDYSKLLYDQAFGMIILDKDLHKCVAYNGYAVQPRTRANVENSGLSEVIDDKEQFKVTLDVRHFTVDEISIRRNGNIIEVKGRHPEKTDAYGVVKREFTRRYLLPARVASGSVKSNLSNGILTIQGRKENVESVPISIDVVSEVKIEVTEKQDVDEAMDDKSTAATS